MTIASHLQSPRTMLSRQCESDTEVSRIDEVNQVSTSWSRAPFAIEVKTRERLLSPLIRAIARKDDCFAYEKNFLLEIGD